MAKKKKKSGKEGSAIKKIAKKIKGAPFTILLPFKGIMKEALLKKGFTTSSDDIATIASMFFKHVVKGQAYEGVSHYEEVDPVTATLVIKGIIEFIKMLKKKKAEGKTLTPEEEKLLKTGDKVEEAFKEVVKDDTEEGIGEIFTKYWWVLALIVAYFVFKGANAKS